MPSMSWIRWHLAARSDVRRLTTEKNQTDVTIMSLGHVTRAFVVVNPRAGGGRTRSRWPAIRDDLARAGITIDVAQTAAPGDATRLARQAANDGWPLVVAVGGDGTVNEVINGIVSPSGQPLATLAGIATGRGRGVCRKLEIGSEPAIGGRGRADAPEVVAEVKRAGW